MEYLAAGPVSLKMDHAPGASKVAGFEQFGIRVDSCWKVSISYQLLMLAALRAN